MAMKLKFKPEITRIKLNPEQAVLTCSCYSRGRKTSSAANRSSGAITCLTNRKVMCGASTTRSSASS